MQYWNFKEKQLTNFQAMDVYCIFKNTGHVIAALLNIPSQVMLTSISS